MSVFTLNFVNGTLIKGLLKTYPFSVHSVMDLGYTFKIKLYKTIYYKMIN